METQMGMAQRVEAIVDDTLKRIRAFPEASVSRSVGLALALPTWTVLGIARWLEPAAEGFGTHRQLGLAGCTVMTLTGWPCPMCGMTTTFSLMADLRFAEAFHNQPFGVVLFTLTFLGALVGLADTLSGGGLLWRILRWLSPYEQKIALSLLVGMILGWGWKMLLMHPSTFGFSA
jgi:hypothetical protein